MTDCFPTALCCLPALPCPADAALPQDLADEELALTQSGGTLSINGTGAHQAEPYAKNDGSRFACTLKLHAACGAAQYAVPKRTDFSADATPDLSVTCSKLGALAAQLSPAEDSTVTAPFSESLGTPRPDGRGNDFSHGGTERISPMKGPQVRAQGAAAAGGAGGAGELVALLVLLLTRPITAGGRG